MLHLAKMFRFTLAVVLTVALFGCGQKDPFPLAPVAGKITYTDGSPIKADQIVVRFFPQGVAIQGKVAPRVGETRADVSDGSFADFTTWKYGDGVMIGKHKVVAIALRIAAHGGEEPSDAIHKRYRDAKTTPLEVEVTAGGENNLVLEIEQGKMK